MKTLIEELNYKDRWYPTAINRYRTYIKLDYNIEGAKQLKDNIAYNLQYLEYIQKQLDELKLSSVIYVMLYKTYIITGMGIVEGLFSNLLKSKGIWNYSEWKSLSIVKSNKYKANEKYNKIHTEIFEQVENYELRMDLDSMIKKIEKKNLIDIEHEHFPTIKRLRELRNRVHLQQAVDKFDTDYHNFSKKEKDEMSIILYKLLTSKEFNTLPHQKDIFEFLNVK